MEIICLRKMTPLQDQGACLVPRSFFSPRNRNFFLLIGIKTPWRDRLILGLGQEAYKMSLPHLIVPECGEVLKIKAHGAPGQDSWLSV